MIDNFMEDYSWFKLDHLRLALDIALKIYTNVAKGLKLKVRKFLVLIPFLDFCRRYREKLAGDPFPPF